MRSVPKQEKVVWELGDEAEIGTVRRIFEMRAEGFGYVGIADTLNAGGITCPKHGRWKNKDNKWTGVSVYGIVRNPAYVGDRVYNRSSFSKILAKEKGIDLCGKWYNDEVDWIVVPNAHPPIISSELFGKANVQVDPRPTRPNQHYYRSTYLLTGLVKCVQCGFNYQGYHHKRTGNNYYIDGGYVNKGKNVCKWFSIRQDKLEEFVLTGIKDAFFASDFSKHTYEYIEELNRQRPSAVEDRLQSIDEILKENAGKISNLVLIAEDGATIRSVGARLRELEEIQEKLEQERRRLEKSKPPTLDPGLIAKAVMRFLSNFERTFDQLSVAERKELLRKIVETILVDKAERKVRCYLKRLPLILNITDRLMTHSVFQGASGSPVNDQLRFQSKNAIGILGAARSPNGARTRISALRGPRPKPLDDRAIMNTKCKNQIEK